MKTQLYKEKILPTQLSKQRRTKCLFELVISDSALGKDSAQQLKKGRSIDCSELNKDSSPSIRIRENLPSHFRHSYSISSEYAERASNMQKEHIFSQTSKQTESYLVGKSSFSSQSTDNIEENNDEQEEIAKCLKTPQMATNISKAPLEVPVLFKSTEELTHKAQSNHNSDEHPDTPIGAASPNIPMSPENESNPLPGTTEIALLTISTEIDLRLTSNLQLLQSQKNLLKCCLNSKNSGIESNEEAKQLALEYKFQQDFDKVMRYMKKKKNPIGKSRFYWTSTLL